MYIFHMYGLYIFVFIGFIEWCQPHVVFMDSLKTYQATGKKWTTDHWSVAYSTAPTCMSWRTRFESTSTQTHTRTHIQTFTRASGKLFGDPTPHTYTQRNIHGCKQIVNIDCNFMGMFLLFLLHCYDRWMWASLCVSVCVTFKITE